MKGKKKKKTPWMLVLNFLILKKIKLFYRVKK